MPNRHAQNAENIQFSERILPTSEADQSEKITGFPYKVTHFILLFQERTVVDNALQYIKFF